MSACATAVESALEPIPFHRVEPLGRELEYVAAALANGRVAGDGPFTKRCQELLRAVVGARVALLTTSCTDALEMAALLLDVGPGDEVLVPSFTFVSTANAFALRGARPVFVDVRPDTLNIDERKVAERVTPQTRAIVPMHYAGVSCELPALCRLADQRGLRVIEDNAHGLFGDYAGRPLGSWGALATLSFHGTKNVTCGEGGALLINDPSLSARAEVLREKGTDRSRFVRGEVDKYTWVDLGSSFLPADLLAAVLWGQLECWEQVQARRRRIWETYASELRDWAVAVGATLPTVPEFCTPAYHLFYVVLPTIDARAGLVGQLRAQGIATAGHYLPLHTSPMGRRFGGRAGDCPVAESVAARLVRLPLHNHLELADVDRVVSAVRACLI